MVLLFKLDQAQQQSQQNYQQAPPNEAAKDPKDVTHMFDPADIEKNKAMGLLGYLIFFIPLLAAKDSAFAKFHANQGFVLFLSFIVASVLWIIPIISNLSLLGLYAFALDVEFSPVVWTVVPMGLLFALIGNYLPKTRMNSTMGIKVYWTYTSEENWNATHRFAGKVWVIGGILLVLCALLQHLWAVVGMLVLFLVLMILPIAYSWRYYKKELAEGKELKKPAERMSPKARKGSAVGLILLTVLLCGILFFGDIHYVFTENSLFIDTNMYTDYNLRFETIENVEFREGNVPGLRVGGFGTFRLLMGWFENEEFGTYTRYTYYNPDACVVITTDSGALVLSAETEEETRELYQILLEEVS